MTILKLAVWNANGLLQHKAEVNAFLTEHNIDIMLISETHFTQKSYFKINGYLIYTTNHPDGKAHGGTAVLIKRRLKHFEFEKYQTNHLQATSICLQEWLGNIVISAAYCPPKHAIKKEQFLDYFKILGNKFLVGGDYNAKHTHWGSRLTTPKGKQLYEATQELNLNCLSAEHPTYWPTDKNKIPDLIDFCVSKGIARTNIRATDCYDLSSDHSPVMVEISTTALKIEMPRRLTNKTTKWDLYRKHVQQNSTLNIPLKTITDIEAATEHLNCILELAAEKATRNVQVYERTNTISFNIQELIQEKRRIRREWQQLKSPLLKWKLNRAIKKLRFALKEEENRKVQDYLSELTPTEATEYSLWKATKKLKRPANINAPIRLPDGNWARSDEEKASAFAAHLVKVFSPHDKTNNFTLPEQMVNYDSTSKPIKFKWQEVKHTIRNNISPKKAPGHDLITGKMIRELPDKCIKLITYIFNAIMRTGYIPKTWKVSLITMIPKPGKDETLVSSYRPISMLPTISKLFEKMLLSKMKPVLDERQVIPDHQFGFRSQHGTTEQVHRIVNAIKVALEQKNYCSAVFLDIAQAFDKVWHDGLIFKIKKLLPNKFHAVLENYLLERQFRVISNGATTGLENIIAGVPQGSVLGPVMYLLYTADLPVTNKGIISTFADDTAILMSHKHPETASLKLQNHLNEIEKWLKTWRIKVNEKKSVHVTFTLNKQTCPHVRLNGLIIPQQNKVKYLGMHLDRRLTWKNHIEAKRKQIKLRFSKMYWLLGRKSKLSLENKVLIYKSMLKPIWTYGIQLWGSTCASNRELMQRTQAKILRSITNAPWYIRNTVIHDDIGIKTIKQTIKEYSLKYYSKLTSHPNQLANNILKQPRYRRLKRADPLGLMDL